MKKVIVGMSGGVDSSVAAYLLIKQGYQVEGVHFTLKEGVGDLADAQKVCNSLGIKLYAVNFSQIFNDKVFQPFISEYEQGLTPNVCVECNKNVKFGALYNFAISQGADYVATGHYASTEIINGRCFLKCPTDALKDQTYFLNQVSERALSQTLFPLSGLNKEQVRKIAEENNLITAHKKGSSDICLMGDLTFREFLKPFVKPKKGKIIDLSGKVVGEHNGLFNFTLGQRKGLGLGGIAGENGGRWFVVGKNVKTNCLIVSHGSEEELFSQSLELLNCNWIGKTPVSGERVLVKTRYAQNPSPAIINFEKEKISVNFLEPQRAITPGQYCVFYQNGYCLGGGKIV